MNNSVIDKVELAIEVTNSPWDFLECNCNKEEIESILDDWKKDNRLLSYKIKTSNGKIEFFDKHDNLIETGEN